MNHSRITQPLPGFFDALYGDSTQSLHIVLWKRSNRQSQWIPLRALDGIVDKFLIGQSYPDLYFGVGLHSQLPENPETNRGGAASVAALPSLWFDLDVACGTHINTDLPTRAEATAFIEKLPFGLPSIRVDTGGGYHLYWLFREMWLLESPAERQEASNLSYRFQQTIRELGSREGWKLDITADLSRVLRVPGSLNTKSTPYQKVRVEQMDTKLRYNPQDFEPYLLEDAPLPSAIQPRILDHICGDISLGSMLEECSWLKHCQRDAAALPEPEWFAMLVLMAKCHDGEKWAHVLSSPYPTYSESETAAKFQHAGRYSNAYSCRKVSALTGGEYCRTCRYWGMIGNPLEIEAQRSLESELQTLRSILKSRGKDGIDERACG